MNEKVGIKVGVLALQGDFEAHERALRLAGACASQVRTAEELKRVDALVIPGGESTTMLKLLHAENLLEPLRCFGRERAIFGTCAGSILIASKVHNPEQESLGLMDIEVERNAYGRQLNSCVAHLKLEEEFTRRVAASNGGGLEAVFIRAPVIRSAGPDVKILARFKGDPVLVEQGRHMVATFHPELTADNRVHRLFLDKIRLES